MNALEAPRHARIGITIVLAARFKLSFHDVYSLWSLVPFGDLKFDILAFVQSFESISLYGAIMDEYVATALFFDKSIPL